MQCKIIQEILAAFFSVIFGGHAASPTEILTTTLPLNGSTNSFARDRFSITASRDLLPASATVANYVLVEAGANGLVGDGDDATIPITVASASGATVNLTILANPLQPGRYRFQTRPTLLDIDTNAVAVFAWDFAIADRYVGKLENNANNTLPEATLLPLAKTPASSSFFTPLDTGSFFSTRDVDYWWFDVHEGDLVTVRLEAEATVSLQNGGF